MVDREENGKITVLIADDDPSVLKTVSKYLRKSGFRVLESENGKDALHLVRHEKPDLIVTDLRMPELDGMQLVAKVVKEAPEIPVIIFSGLGTMSDVIDALRAGAWDFITKPIHDMELLPLSIHKAMERVSLLRLEKERQGYLEKEVRKRTMELLQQNMQLEREMAKRQVQESLVLRAKQEWERTVDAMPDMIAIVDKNHKVIRINKTMLDRLGKSYGEIQGKRCTICVHGSSSPPDFCPHSLLLKDGQEHRAEIYEERLGGHCEIIVVPYCDAKGTLVGSVHVIRDINRQKQNERETEKLHAQLLHAQKLESVGQLASGIAHEINTPTQFIGTNVAFLEEAFQDVSEIISSFKTLTRVPGKDIGESFDVILEKADWPYLVEEIPNAISQSLEGVGRVASIVGAMKEFSHPGTKSKGPADLNHIIDTTIIVARNEWKYVADMKTDLDAALPKVQCLVDEMGQVILNIIVNAAHAIGKKLGDNPEGEKGIIGISSRISEDSAEIVISDTGAGMTENVQARIFDPFFTTKQVGKGTGQGMAIARDVIVDKHDGSIEVYSAPEEGTTLTIRIPLVPYC